MTQADSHHHTSLFTKGRVGLIRQIKVGNSPKLMKLGFTWACVHVRNSQRIRTLVMGDEISTRIGVSTLLEKVTSSFNFNIL